MGARVPAQHYNLNSPSSFIESPLHVLNAVEARTAASAIDHITAGDNPDDDSASAIDCMNESHRSCLPLHSVEVDEDRASLDTNESSRTTSYDILTVEDVSPIESARARFLQIVVDHFINDRVIEVPDSEADYAGQDKMSKRRTREIQYEGDPNFALPLMYVANMYESLVSDVNNRLASVNGIREKTIGVALEAAGGLYRRLAKKFPKKGPYTFKRRELATSMETRTRFPELVIQEEKRVRFVVVNGLRIVEKPNNVPIDDAEWFRRLTGRSEVAITASDYKYYSPRHKYRRGASISLSSIPDIPSYPGAENSTALATTQGFRSPQNQQQTPCKHHLQSFPHQPQFHPVLQNNSTMHQSQHAGPYSHNPQSGPPSHLSEISHAHQPISISQHMNCLQPLSGGLVGGRLHMLPTTPAKFCDECGAPYLRETSKFCSECGSKRLGT
ncbi:hypothetical protein PHAVU_002G186800 [Phaseolus vulgaris]|uniref:Uncharacterized protein n=1 Tax=Phaseolus vulgaris TaxID=3885 RepID=V7CL36_PHAVU|nr:hypothetical protein PHAVU_002G186800g [Phaseolus vulgaris]XP_007158845.1 hypothetical protein PHAVU_002G186800g [Phaseolus vulgaris]ESW30838.1 hypothetical protein PHAVU_002G186800g [Phaseolus vulgaris]ESW30839.1 hypothetical protein PHAVU_002G186800g [Phaseolus vulgaris]